ncbi:MAG: diguanylate cyclase [Proteobacteria bacterium]|nr:diguanylate cyclase [Pseudomonadota bacterium]MBU1594923.1 diguanylate cyclase [Pseudomonadota bacterium]
MIEDRCAPMAGSAAQPDLKRVLEVLQGALQSATAPEALPEDLLGVQGLAPLYTQVIDLRRFILGLSQGDLRQKLAHKGYLAGVLKMFQSNLSHLTWQTQMLAGGDFSQRVDFLGDFSIAFNSMVERLRDASRAIHESEERYRFLAENSVDIIWRLDAEHHIIYASPADERIRGFHYTEVLGQEVWRVMQPDFVALMQERCRGYLASIAGNSDPLPLRVEVPLLCKDGGSVWAEILSKPVRGNNGSLLGFHLVARDISQRKAYEEQLVFVSTHDALTGLHNRAHFEAEFNRAAQGRALPVSVIMADVDGLKAVNDNLGHAAGDEMIKAAADILRRAFRTGDLVARLGGDEFAVLLVGADEHCVAQSLKRIRAEQKACCHRDSAVPVRISLGAATARTPAELGQVLREADRRMYKNKSEHKIASCARPSS